jgi:hypothetical protein
VAKAVRVRVSSSAPMNKSVFLADLIEEVVVDLSITQSCSEHLNVTFFYG